ncbi:MAG: ABC transporter substrate-binding protein [Anaerolineales bacterium]
MKRMPLALFILIALCVGACAGPASTPISTSVPTEAPAPTPAPVSTGTVTVLDWSGYEDPTFWEPFATKHAEAKVDFAFFAEDAEAYAKMQTGFPTDLVHPCNSWWQLYVDAGLVQPLDTARLSNWSGIRPELAELGEFNGQQYFVPWDWGYESILVRTDKVTDVPDSWADLWDPQYAGHVALWDSGEANYAMTALSLGFDPWKTTPEQTEQIKQKLIEIKPNLVTYWVDFTEVPQLIASGDAWLVSNAWQDAYTSSVDEGSAVEYITPKEGRLGWVCGYGLSSKAQNVDLAYDYLDAIIAPQSMANMSNAYAYGAANQDALALTDPTYVELMQLDQPNLTERTVFYQPLTQEQREAWVKLWDDVKAAP